MLLPGAFMMGTFLEEVGVCTGVEVRWSLHLTMPASALVLVLVLVLVSILVGGAGLAPLRKARPLTDGADAAGVAGAAGVVRTPGMSETIVDGGWLVTAPALSVCGVAATDVGAGAGAVSDAILIIKLGSARSACSNGF